MVEHQARAMQQAGRVANKYSFPHRGLARMDKKFVEPERAWILIDAWGQSLGRLAARIAPLLAGKHKPTFQPVRDVGDHVVVVNAAYIVVPEKAMDNKKYYHHSGYPGGLKTTPLWRLFESNPTEPLRRAIFGMLPKNRLRHQRMARLRLFPAGEHAQEAQFRAFQGKAFRGRMSGPNGKGPMVLERIQPAENATSTP